MDWEIQSPTSNHFFRVTTHGEFTTSDYPRMVEEIVSQDSWEPGSDMLIDHRDLDFSRSDHSTMRRAASQCAPYSERLGSCMAAVLVADDTAYGSIRQFLGFKGDKVDARVKIFFDAAEAEAWLQNDTVGNS